LQERRDSSDILDEDEWEFGGAFRAGWWGSCSVRFYQRRIAVGDRVRRRVKPMLVFLDVFCYPFVFIRG
jgi:hypothetical protein